MNLTKFSLKKVVGLTMPIIGAVFVAFSLGCMEQEHSSGKTLQDRWFAENDRCTALTNQHEQDTCWTSHVSDMQKFPEEYKAYKDERKRRAWDAGELNHWEDDPCKMDDYGEFSMNDMQSMDPKESAD